MMLRRVATCLLGLSCLLALGATSVAAANDLLPDTVEFNKHIRPILSNSCFLCHGPDSAARKAGLRLDTRDDAIAARDDGPAIVPGDITASALIARVTDPDANHRMPPPEANRDLDEREIALLTKWVEQGAEYQPHWAYIPPGPTAPPAVEDDWARNPVDTFILARLKEEGLEPAPEADRVTQIRRLYFDLIGLPPSYDEVQAFVNETSPNAYENLVDRLLASEHFGERLAVYWLDLVRYADTVGYHGDQPRGASGYRDYVIDAFNANMPFDQFTREQLAGDLLEDPTFGQLLASGYNRLNQVTREGGAQEGDYIVRYAADRVRTTASVWLGSSMGCAECHDHKFDPFTQKDFYSFGAFFDDIKESGVQSERGNEGPFPPFALMPTPEQATQLGSITHRLAELAAQTAASNTPDENAQKEIKDLSRQLNALEGDITTSVITEHAEPRTMRVLPRGNWQDESGEIVTPAIPAFLGALESGNDRLDRRDLANWLTSPDNPLTARVFVNRLWYLYFGAGISKVLDDVGSQGEWPTHPELLDYLALEFIESGWDIKHMVELIVTSAAYRQSSATRPDLRTIDPYNRLIARQSRMRLDAELIRDNALKVSGLLVPTIGGPSVKPYQPAGYYRELNFPERSYQQDAGDNLYRRGVYTHWQRTYLHPSLLAFDAPTREECTAERPVSNSPQQALALLNDPIFVEAARVFAERILEEGPANTPERIHFAFHQALSREPTKQEAQIITDLYEKHLEEFTNDTQAAIDFINIGDAPVPQTDPIQLAAWTSVSRTLINLHEFIHRY